MIGPCTTRPNRTAIKRRAAAMLRGLTDTHADRDRDIVARYVAGELQRDLAVEYGISPERVSAIVRARCCNAG